MESVLDFLANNYIWFLAAAVVLAIILVIFIVSSKKKEKDVENVEEIEDNTNLNTMNEGLVENITDSIVTEPTLETPVTPVVEEPVMPTQPDMNPVVEEPVMPAQPEMHPAVEEQVENFATPNVANVNQMQPEQTPVVEPIAPEVTVEPQIQPNANMFEQPVEPINLDNTVVHNVNEVTPEVSPRVETPNFEPVTPVQPVEPAKEINVQPEIINFDTEQK